MRRRNADVLGVLLSFTLLAMCLLAVLLGGVRVYRGLAERGQESFQRRTAMEFLETRLRQADSAGGVWLGAFDGTESREGDTLFLYTDGVTEALDPDEQLFGEDRLRDALNDKQGIDLRVSELLPYVRSALEKFARGAEQADDITMLGITYRGPGKEGEA